MMPIVEQSPVHHHHNYAHQTYYHQQQQMSEQTGKMQLTLILPNGVPSVITVDANTPMMDLLVQAASLNKLNPSGYSLVVLDSNQHVIQFKANQTVGQIGSSTISLLPKEPTHVNTSSKPKTQPFEITVRLQVNLPDAQKILLRVDPTLPLHEIKEQICKQKKYSNSNEYTLCLPTKLDQPLSLGLSLAECKTNELTLIHKKFLDTDYQQLNSNQIQSFDRLYRTRSESQPPKETYQDIQTEPKFNSNRSSTLRPSHTSLHAYWNDPNFDTQSQISSCSSNTKKRRAPRPPGYVSPTRNDPQIVYIQRQQQQPSIVYSPSPPLRLDHHQSHESIQSENTKKKRKAPVVLPKKDQSEQQQEVVDSTTRPSLEPLPPPVSTNNDSSSANNLNEDLTHNPIDNPQTFDSPQIPINTKLTITTNPIESTNNQIHSPEQIQTESINVTTPPIFQQEETKLTPPKTQSTNEPPLVNSPVPKPPRQNLPKEKKSSTIDGLLRIVNDHTKRTTNEKQTNENITYFRVAKSRCGKFETDNQGFVNNAIAIFDSTNQPKNDPEVNKNSQSSPTITNQIQQKSSSSLNYTPHQTKGKQAYNLLKKYEKEEEFKSSNNTDYLKTTNEKEKSPTQPIQVGFFQLEKFIFINFFFYLEVTERTTHITVTVESDRKQLITRVSPIAQQASPPLPPPPPPPITAPKPFGKTITEYRTVRRINNNDEQTTVDMNNKRLSSNSGSSHEELMEAIRRFGGSQNLGKNN